MSVASPTARAAAACSARGAALPRRAHRPRRARAGAGAPDRCDLRRRRRVLEGVDAPRRAAPGVGLRHPRLRHDAGDRHRRHRSRGRQRPRALPRCSFSLATLHWSWPAWWSVPVDPAARSQRRRRVGRAGLAVPHPAVHRHAGDDGVRARAGEDGLGRHEDLDRRARRRRRLPATPTCRRSFAPSTRASSAATSRP